MGQKDGSVVHAGFRYAYICASGLRRSEEWTVRSSETRVTDSYKAIMWVLKDERWSSGDQPVPLTNELSL